MCVQFLWLLKYPFSLYLACPGFSEQDDQWHTDAHRAGAISFLGVSAKLFPEGQLIHMWIQWLSKAGDPQNCWRASSNPPNIRLEQKKQRKGEFACFAWSETLVLSCCWTLGVLVLTSRLEPRLISSTPPVFQPLNLDWIIPWHSPFSSLWLTQPP